MHLRDLLTRRAPSKTMHPLNPGVAAVDSKPGKSVNQDAGDVYHGRQIVVLALADGVGSATDSELAAQSVVRSFISAMTKLDHGDVPITASAVKECLSQTHLDLQALYEATRGRYDGQRAVLQTTLLTVVDVGDRYIVSYVGNGSIYYIRGDIEAFLGRRWPWTVTNIVTGHAVLDQATGKDELRHTLDPQRESPPMVLIEHSKDFEWGDLLLVCTDGVASDEQLRTGYDSNQKLWVEINAHTKTFIENHLGPFLQRCPKLDECSRRLKESLRTFLETSAFEDDATVGVVLSARLIERLS
jgi:hypothetical protein